MRTALALGALLACAPAPNAPHAEREAMQRGTVVIAHEVRSFRPCGETRELWLVPTPELTEAARALGPTPGAPIYVELHGDLRPAPATGFGADYPAQLVARELLRAAPAAETHGCAEDLHAVEFRAAGNEPFWSVEVASGRLRLRRPGEAEFDRAVGSAHVATEGWSYRPPAGADGAEAFQLVLERGPCADSMVGTRTRWRARFELDGVRYHGCAWEGEASP